MAIAKKEIRKAYVSYTNARTENDEISLTEQHHKDSCDINKIMGRYRKTGVIDHLNKHGPLYGEIPSIGLQEATEIVEKADEMFNDLPSHIRNKFDNKPGEFLDFVQDPANLEEMRELGLSKEDAPVVEKVVPEVQEEPIKPAAE